MNKAKHCSFHITLTAEEKIRCWTIDEEERKKQIELKEGEEEYDCSIQFDRNEIVCCSTSEEEEKEGSIKFVNDMISQPREMKKYNIKYQEKEYEVIGEVLLALIVNEFKKKAEKEMIIDETFVSVESDSHYLCERITTSLESI